MKPWLYILLAAALAVGARADPPQGAWVNRADDGRLLYQRDTVGNRLPDFGACGYRAGRAGIPVAPVRVAISPGAGDDTALIQSAVNQVAALSPDANGIRGAVLLNAGEYQLSNTVTLAAGGVVLRGVGDSDAGTRLRATAKRQYTLINLAGSGSRAVVGGTTHSLVDTYVPVGARSFLVDSAGGLTAGELVQVIRPSTSNWLHDIGMDQLDYPWQPGDRDITWDRVITRIEGLRIFLDAPITTAIESKYGGGAIRQYTWSGRIEQSGVEDIKGISDYTNSTDEAHGWTFIGVSRAQNCWVRRVTSQYFGYACVTLSDAKWVSVLDSDCLDPISIIDGGRRYAFGLNGSQLCLVRGCYTRKDRHQYVTGSNTPGPDAFVSSDSDTAYSDAGPHHRWAHGILWDRITVNGNNLNMQNRGNLGTGHGWSGANCVAWNCDADGGFAVQNPPTAHNWLIGSVGAIENGTVYVGPHDPGTYDAHGANVFPSSLWGNQRQDAQQEPGLQVREYVAGDFDAYASSGGTGDATAVDAAWAAALDAGTTLPLHGFDRLAGNHWVPWTHTFTLDPGDAIVSATLQVSLRGQGSGWTNDLIYLDDLASGRILTNFTGAITTSASSSTVLRLDLAADLGLLADGQLNVAVGDDVAVDWSVLELRVRPALTNGVELALAPEADAYVRDGAFAGQNFGAETSLAIKNSSSGYNRRAYLRWDLSAVTSRLLHARVRLMPVSVSQDDIEHAAAIVTATNWAEGGLTWSNQPAAGALFVSWSPRASNAAEFAVTAEVGEALAGSKRFGLQLFSVRLASPDGYADYESSESATASNRPQLLLTLQGASNTPPAISLVNDRSIPEDATTGPIAFTVADAETAAAALTVAGGSSNQALAPNASLVIAVTTNPWTGTDIGAVGAAGSSLPGDVFSLRASGADFWGTADEGHYIHQPMTSDGEIVARVTSLQNTDPWAKAGVMLRSGADASSAHGFMLVSAASGVAFQRRLTNGAATLNSQVAGIGVPVWLRLTRATNSVRGYYAPDSGGAPGAWVQVGPAETIALGGAWLCGLAGSSHTDGVICASTLDHVSGPANAGGNRTVTVTPLPNATGAATITLWVGDGSLTATQQFDLVVTPVNDPPYLSPANGCSVPEDTVAGPIAFTIGDMETAVTGLIVTASSSNPSLVPASNLVVSAATNPWTGVDLGAVGAAGSGLPGDIFTLAASGADIWGAADEGHFLYQAMTNDGEMVARVTCLQATDPWAKAGVMMRAGEQADSANAFMLVSASNGVSFQRRPDLGEDSLSSKVAGIAAPVWVKLVRAGATNLAGFYAPDNAGAPGAWVQVGPAAGVDMAGACLRGLAGTSHSDGTLGTSTYDHVSGPALVGGNRSLLATPLPNASGTAVVSVVVSDGASSVTQRFTLVVTPANDPPQLAAVSNRIINPGVTLALTNTAADIDLPAQTLAFSLVIAPSNATLATNTGVFTWRPAMAQAGSSNLVRVKVVDNGPPPLSATQSFAVLVNAVTNPPASSSAGIANGRISLAITGLSGPDYVIEVSSNLTAGWRGYVTNVSPALPLVWTETNAPAGPQQFYRIRLGP